MRELNKIIIHYSWTPASMDIGVEEIRRWHLERGWQDIGYHFVLRRNGIIELGRPIEIQGAHTRGQNQDSIGICIVGGKPDVNFTKEQWSSLSTLVAELMFEHNIYEVGGHRDYAASECPGFDVRAWWDA